MDLKTARSIIKKTEKEMWKDYANNPKNHQKNAFAKGVAILAKYCNNMLPEFGHDVIWFCDFEKSIETMTKEDIEELVYLGFKERDENWSY